MTRPTKQYEFVYKLMYYYYIDMYHEYLELQKMKDDYWPNLEMIDRTNKMLRIKSVANSKHLDEGKMNVIGNDDTLKSKFFLRDLAHPDLYDCIMPINNYDVDYSILVNHYAIKRRYEKKVLNLRLYIPVSKQLTNEEVFDYDYHDIKTLDESKNKNDEDDDPTKNGKQISLSAQAVSIGATHH